MSTQGRNGFWNSKYTFRNLNVMFVLLMVIGIVSLISDLGDTPDVERIAANAEAVQPVIAAAILIPVIAIFAVIFSIGTGIDRRCSEDYAFQLMATAALATLPTILFSHAAWMLLAKFGPGIPVPMGNDIIALLMIGFSSAWFTLRVKGL
ncbi:MAG: hypothetical protein AAFX04_04050 [Pseudomonadota bacterium]